MVRPVISRRVGYKPEVSYFKPRGIPMFDLIEVCLTVDEREAIRLADLEGLSHEEGGQEMGVSRATFGRILRNARTTVADAIINGKAISVQGGHYEIVITERRFVCAACKHQWTEPPGTGRPKGCPLCASLEVDRLND
ncbi:conserved hypothetical protein [Desulforapulum autotrophicum HRM2]|uniref:UPF0251 protein HRM2_31170 n=1 Tax=Desulforapulum autotrophicum (strain ATCC 43914 / DSM 3382 / VKM B-1955 / HRM2) TaxID=177437 RepID=C0QKW0_DESAH|nr:DUF134 domain-containing protein [Desulforapulum autotrophicum]ACN16200.1 conserved hypothetical protein [Desulforapulum autotrophicum HRM2]